MLAASRWSIERKLLIAQTLSDVGNPRNYRAALERVGAQPLICLIHVQQLRKAISGKFYFGTMCHQTKRWHAVM